MGWMALDAFGQLWMMALLCFGQLGVALASFDQTEVVDLGLELPSTCRPIPSHFKITNMYSRHGFSASL